MTQVSATPSPDAGPQYPFGTTQPAPGALLEVAPGVHWLRMPLPFALDHINLWALEDGDGWTLVDTGLNSGETRQFWDRLFTGQMAGRPVRRIIVTHYHADHIGLAGWLAARFDVPLAMTEGEYLTAQAVYHELPGHDRVAMFDLLRRHGLEETRIEGIKSFAGAYRRLIETPPDTFQRIMPGQRFSIGGRDWAVVLGYGHAPEHVSLHCAELGVMIAGDMVLPRISTNVSVRPVEPEGNPLARFLDSLERYALLPADTLVLPSHGLPFRGLHGRLEQLREHHAQRLAELREACREGASARDVVPVLFRRALDDRQWYFAMGEAIAHLNYLLHARALEHVADPDGILRFRACA